jgi:hypothetical protein
VKRREGRNRAELDAFLDNGPARVNAGSKYFNQQKQWFEIMVL